MFGEGVANLYLAYKKSEWAAGFALATPESGPGAAATASGAMYLTVSALSAGMTGTAQLVGAFTGNTDGANKAADGLAASTSASGIITSVWTGDLKKGARAASIEGIATSSFKREIFENAASITEVAIDIIDLVSPPPAPPMPPTPPPPQSH
jgi:hypothetical protein